MGHAGLCQQHACAKAQQACGDGDADYAAPPDGADPVALEAAMLAADGIEVTQATLSRDLKQLKVAKAASMNGKYVYVLPNNIMYKRSTDQSAGEMLRNNGFISLQFSGNIAVIRTRPGYASSMAYDIDNRECPAILGTIAGDDTIMMVLHEAASHEEVRMFLSQIIPNIK